MQIFSSFHEPCRHKWEQYREFRAWSRKHNTGIIELFSIWSSFRTTKWLEKSAYQLATKQHTILYVKRHNQHWTPENGRGQHTADERIQNPRLASLLRSGSLIKSHGELKRRKGKHFMVWLRVKAIHNNWWQAYCCLKRIQSMITPMTPSLLKLAPVALSTKQSFFPLIHQPKLDSLLFC